MSGGFPALLVDYSFCSMLHSPSDRLENHETASRISIHQEIKSFFWWIILNMQFIFLSCLIVLRMVFLFGLLLFSVVLALILQI